MNNKNVVKCCEDCGGAMIILDRRWDGIGYFFVLECTKCGDKEGIPEEWDLWPEHKWELGRG